MTKSRMKMVRVNDIAEMFSISKWYLYRLTAKGKIPFYKFGRTILFDPDEVEAYIRQFREGPEEAE